ncbi:TBC1 domain family member 20 [Histomonas meleagridis]|uniref:TBC1 domain family member 20 n=1 Tax=Histomonas meleagridis TaxID=135588 RepID=UPI003559D18C|nr:TBC1 domain family member 20 [Histomonas meleagridis]KAH0802714.1 TBC1 domain family member 20 [Histomonas meleagridis]
MDELGAIIQNAQNTKDISSLRKHCVHGYGNNSQRRASYRLLLDIPNAFTPTIAPKYDFKDIDLVKKDVHRSYSSIQSQECKTYRKEKLLRVLSSLFERHNDLTYYQGFQEIAIIVLTFARESFALQILEALALGPLHCFLGQTLGGIETILDFSFSLLRIVDNDIYVSFEKSDIQSHLLVSFIVTFFAHNVPDIESGLRFLDFFIASHPLIPTYTIISIISLEREKMMKRNFDPNTILSILQDTNFTVDQIINNTVEIYQKYPPNVVLNMDKSLQISEDCIYLSPRISFPYPFPSFPFYNPISLQSYTSHLEGYKDKSFVAKILKDLAIAASIGMRIIFSE